MLSCVAILWSLVMAGPGGREVAAASTPTPEGLIAAVRAQEQAILGLRVRDSRVRVSAGASAEGPWEMEPSYVMSDIWLDGSREGPYRLKLHRWLTPWQGGASPFLEVSRDMSFDGETFRSVYRLAAYRDEVAAKMGWEALPTLGEMVEEDSDWNPTDWSLVRDLRYGFPVRSAAIGGRPLAVSGEVRRVDLLAMTYHGPTSVAFLFERLTQPYLLSTDLAELHRVGELVISEITVGERRLIRATRRNPEIGRVLYFDPSRGLALARFVELAPPHQKGVVLRAGEVHAWAEVKPGMFHPKESTLVTLMPDEQGTLRYLRYESSSAALMAEDSIPREEFRSVVPANVFVNDQSADRVFKSSQPPAERYDTIRKRAEQGRALALADATSESEFGWRWWWVAGGACVVGAVAILGMKRIRGRGTVLGFWIMATALVASVDTSAGQVDVRHGDAQGLYRQNCGLDATLAALAWYGVAVNDLDRLIESLELGPELLDDTSLGRIAELLSSAGLKVEGFAAENAIRLVAAIDVPSVVHTTRNIGGKDVGHFLFVVPVGQRLIVFDGDGEPVRVHRNVAARDVLLNARHFLKVAPGKVRPPGPDGDGRLLLVVPSQFDLGRRTFSDGDVRVVMVVRNVSRYRLRLENSDSCCGRAIVEIENQVIEPGAQSGVTATLRATHQQSGVNRRTITIGYSVEDDAKAGSGRLEIPVVFELVAPAVIRAVQVTPQQLTLPRSRLGVDPLDRQVTVIVPRELSPQPPGVEWVERPEGVSGVPGEAVLSDALDQWTIRVPIRIRPPVEAGAVRGVIVLRVRYSDTTTQMLSVPLSADWVP